MNNQRASIFNVSFTEGDQNFVALGFVVFWNVRDISVTLDEFSAKLKTCGLPEKYAKEHNVRSSFIRAMNGMEDNRIIRKISENGFLMRFQFTGENVVSIGDEHELDYKKEAILQLDKTVYFDTQDFNKALTCDDQAIREIVIKAFDIERQRYTSNDVTRCIQNILNEKADIVSLRDQGCVYFVPAAYRDVMDKVIKLVTGLGSSTMNYIPLMNIAESRSLVGNAFSDEIDALINKLDKEISTAEILGKDVVGKFGDTKLEKIIEILGRVKKFTELIGADKVNQINSSFDGLVKRVGRKLIID